MTFAEALQKVIRTLNEGRSRAPEGQVTAEAERLLSAAAGRTGAKRLSRMELYARAGDEAPAEVFMIAERMARERAGGKPLQYVIGSQDFLDHEYEVTPDVLIPRPETEVLVTESIRALSTESPRLGYEIGVGSGILSIELLWRFPDLEMVATDVSARAIEVARRNAKRILGAGASRFRLVQVTPRDIWEPVAKGSERSKPDFLISNPPYLMPEEATEEVRAHEPREALFPPAFGPEGPDPLYFYEQIAAQAMFFLRDGGHVFLELPHERASRIGEIFTGAGWSATLVQDLTGRDRVLIAREIPEKREKNLGTQWIR